MQISEVRSLDTGICSGINALLPQLTDRAEEMTLEALQIIIESEGSTLMAAVENGKVLGCLVLTVFPVLTDKRGWIDDLVVCTTHRGRGIGRKLMAAALRKAKSLGARSVNLTCHPRRKAANSLYRRLGFTLRETNVYHYDL